MQMQRKFVSLMFAAVIPAAFFLMSPVVYADGTYSGGDNTNTSTSSPGSDAYPSFFISVPPAGLVMTGITINVKSTSGAVGYAKVAWNNSSPVSSCVSFHFPATTGIHTIVFDTPITVPAGVTTNSLLNLSYFPGCGSVNFSLTTKIYSLSTGLTNGYHIVNYQPLDFSTRIVPSSPMGALSGTTNVSTTTATTTVDFSADYFYSSTTPQTAGFDYDQISLRLNRLDAASSSEYVFSVATDTLSTISNTVILPANSAWGYYWGFSGIAPWGRIDGAYSPTQNLFVLSNPIPTYIGTSTDNLTGLATSTCSISNISGCFQNSISFLFWPQPTTFDQFKAIQGNVRSHAPFGYIFLLNSSINSINSTASSSFSLDIPSELQTSYFDPLKSALAIILFSLTGFWFYKRIRDLHL